MTPAGPSHTPHPPSGRIAPDPVYSKTVLEPMFAGAARHAEQYQRLDRVQTVALHEAGIISQEQAAKLLDALERLPSAVDPADANAAAGGAFEDLFFLREHQLRLIVGEDLAGRLHAGRSRNDLEATLFRLQLRERMLSLLAELAELTETVLSRAEQGRTTLILAYTHQQPAQPSTLGHYLAAFAEVLLRDIGRLEHAYADLDLCPLGAAAITGTGFPLDRALMARLLGFKGPQDNTYGCIAAADQFAAAFGAIKLLAFNIGRLAQDLAFWTSYEVAQAELPEGFCHISSIMPQKRNPLAIEHVRAMASLMAGHCDAVIGAIHNTPFADMVDAESPTQSAGHLAFDMAARVLPLMRALLANLKINDARVKVLIAQSCATMTELSDSLVRHCDLPFRTAHEICTALSADLRERGAGMDALDGSLLVSLVSHHAQRTTELAPETLLSLATPEHAIAVRRGFGGVAPGAVADSIGRYRLALARHRDFVVEVEDRAAGAVAALRDLLAAIDKGPASAR